MRGMGPDDIGNTNALVLRFGVRLGRFLRAAGRLVASVDVERDYD